MEITKLTEAQINEYVQSLIKDFYIGNGEPSIRQTVRDTYKLLNDSIQRWESREEEHRLDKEKANQERIDTLLFAQKEVEKSKKFWLRSVGVLVFTQVIIFVFSFLY